MEIEARPRKDPFPDSDALGPPDGLKLLGRIVSGSQIWTPSDGKMTGTALPDDAPPDGPDETNAAAISNWLLIEIDQVQSEATGATALMELLNVAAGSPVLTNDELFAQIEYMGDEGLGYWLESELSRERSW